MIGKIPFVPRRITIHCSASKNGNNDVDIETIRGWHKKRGFLDVGYHFVICVDGRVQLGRPLNVQGAHVEGENIDNVGICMVGNDKFTRRQWDSLRNTLDSLFMTQLQIPLEAIYCHNQFQSAITQGKTCPNFSVNSLLCWYYMREDKPIASYIYAEG